MYARQAEPAQSVLQVSGGGVYDRSSYYTLIAGNSFIQNYAPKGGAIAAESSYTTVVSPNVFTRNSADTALGGANISVTASPTDGATNFCPSQPAGVVVPGLGGVVNSSELGGGPSRSGCQEWQFWTFRMSSSFLAAASTGNRLNP